MCHCPLGEKAEDGGRVRKPALFKLNWRAREQVILKDVTMYFLTFLAAVMLSSGPRIDTLRGVTVVADRGQVVSRTDTVKINQSQPISNLFQQTPGFIVGDNGGLAGLKTLSLRGMGSAHTAIYLDGVRVNNVQSGQMDLGLLGLDIVDAIVVDYAQNSVGFNTSKPVFSEDRMVNGKAGFRGGSFTSFSGYSRVNMKLPKDLVFTLYADACSSKGNYRYELDGSEKRRENNDITKYMVEGDLFGQLSDIGVWRAKLYYHGANRGTPGSIYYPSSERQKDNAVAAQGNMKFSSGIFSVLATTRFAYDAMSYMDSEYGQTDFQLNTVNRFRLAKWLSVSLTADLQCAGLKSSGYDASRFAALAGAGMDVNVSRLKAQISSLYEGTFDKGYKSRHNFAPSADFRVKVLDGFDIVAFARKAYRIPTFNELYYVGYGNPDLKQEDAFLSDIGIDFNKALSDYWTIKSKLDGFYYLLSDKISSAPTPEDPNIWQPYNIGKVHSRGLDVMAGFDYVNASWKASLLAKYSFQSAIDKTPDSYSYGTQIPYIAKNSFNVIASASFKLWSAQLSWNLRDGLFDSYGEMPDWNTLDIFFSRSFKRKCQYDISANLLNICDCRYNLVSGYPMPGRSFTISLEIHF